MELKFNSALRIDLQSAFGPLQHAALLDRADDVTGGRANEGGRGRGAVLWWRVSLVTSLPAPPITFEGGNGL